MSLKRGLANADIYSLSFNHDSSLIGITSGRGTLHIYNLLGKSSAKSNETPEREKEMGDGAIAAKEDSDEELAGSK